MTSPFPVDLSCTELAVSTQALSKAFGVRCALANVALQVPHGAVYLLGAGDHPGVPAPRRASSGRQAVNQILADTSSRKIANDFFAVVGLRERPTRAPKYAPANNPSASSNEAATLTCPFR